MGYNFDLGIDDQEAFIDRVSQFNVSDLLQKSARMYANRVAVEEPGRSVTYAELDERVNRLGNALLNRGYDAGESTFAVLAENRGEQLEVLYTGAKLGCLVPTLNWRLKREELVHCVDLVDPDVLFVSEQYREKTQWLDEDADPEYVYFDGRPDGTEYDDIVAEGSADEPLPDRRVDAEEGLAVLYTSGTTGLPKGVVISHRAWLARAYKNIVDFDLRKGDDQLIWPPIFHMISADWIPTIAMIGGTYYPIDGFDTERIYEILLEDGPAIGWMVLLPGVVERFLDYLETENVDVDDLREFRNLGALVDLVDPKKVQRVTEAFDMPYANTYGATENDNALSSGNRIPVGVRPTDKDLAKVESSFIDVKLIDEEWNEVADRGELVVRGPSLCSGYVNNADANRENFNDGWFRTGDIFVANDDGTYNFVNRRKYLIKSGGENIYPAELEQVLLEHDEVLDAIVVRTRDEKWGEVPRAVVSARDPSDTLKEELMGMLRERLAGYKLPHYIEVADPASLPRSATGKIVREDVENWETKGERVREV